MYLKSEEYEDTFVAYKKFNTTTYYVYLTLEYGRVYVCLASGKKRKFKSTFEDKVEKSDGGLEALIWVRDTILNFPEWFKTYPRRSWYGKLKYIQLKGSDGRRNKIYKHFLSKYGFNEEHVPHFGKILCKRLGS